MYMSIENFTFGEHVIRTTMIDGTPWFVAKDVCEALEIGNATMSLRALGEDEHKNLALNSTEAEKFGFDYQRVREINLVNESGMYTLILRCRAATTEGSVPYRFRRWVTGEVLPPMRQNTCAFGNTYSVRC
ncbi:TPA: hypothetical protein PCJ90_001343 [Klebsiella quasipneumoniae]|nr:hypothetical protein [Klebsiella quasipneumoniae]